MTSDRIATEDYVDGEIAGVGGTAADVTADSTTLVGTGTNVQAVVEELDNAIVAAETATSDHLADATAAHAASAIAFTPDGSIAATTVQAAIVEVRDEAAGGGAPSTADYLVGTANGGLSAEIAVGTSPGGELGGTWASPTVDATHSGSTHAATQAAAEATAASALATHEADTTSIHGIANTANLETTSGAQTKVDAHVNDTSAAHAASAISADSTTLVGTGTDVQAVLEELDNGLATKAEAVAQGRAVYSATTGYSVPGVALSAVATAAVTANTLYYYHFTVDTAITLDQLAFNVTAGPASDALVRLGIYAADTGWQPTGTPLVDAEVAVAAAFTGVKTSTISLTLQPGRYVFAHITNVILTYRTWRGWPASGLIVSTLAATAGGSGGFIATTYGAMPSSPTLWTTLWASGDHLAVMRISTP